LRHSMPFSMQQSAPGSGFVLGFPRGPRVLPGEYTVKLNIDGRDRMAKSVMVEEDPRIQIAPADAEARLRTLLTVNRLQKSGNDALRSLSNLRKELVSLQENLKKQPSVPDQVNSAVNSLQQETEKLQRRLLPQLGSANQQENGGPANPERMMAIMLRISQLFAALDGYTEPPSQRQKDQLQNFTAQLSSVIEQVNRLITESVPNLNKQIEAAGASPIKA